MSFILKHLNKYNETHYFVACGATHFSASLERTIHLISHTTEDAAKARRFETEEEANTILARSGSPLGWEVVAIK